MALSSCLYRSLSSPLPNPGLRCPRTKSQFGSEGKCDVKNVNTQPRNREVISSRTLLRGCWNFIRRPRINFASNQSVRRRKVFDIQASWLSTSQIARSVFTFGTAAVLPFYTLMVLAPKAEITKKVVESNIPYILLGLLYAYLLYLSWTPNTLRFMFSGKYLLPELQGIAKMFSSEMTLASAWIHLLVVDLFAARQVFHDGIENKIETRHSISLCLLFCPIGVFSHFITKALTNNVMNTEHGK